MNQDNDTDSLHFNGTDYLVITKDWLLYPQYGLWSLVKHHEDYCRTNANRLMKDCTRSTVDDEVWNYWKKLSKL